MTKKNFSVSSIEEDFRRIGIAPSDELTEGYVKIAHGKEKSIPNKPAKPVEPDSAVTGKPLGRAGKPNEIPAVEEPQEGIEPSEDSVEEAEVPEGTELSERVKLLRKRRATGKLRMLRRKQKMMRRRQRAKLKMKAKRYRRSSRGKRFLKKYKQVKARFHGHIPKGRRISLKSGLDRVSNLIEEVSDIVTATDAETAKTSKLESVKSFANLALISNTLAEEFSKVCKLMKSAAADSKDEAKIEDEVDFCAEATAMESVSERSAAIAEGIDASLAEGAQAYSTNEEIQTNFNEIMSKVMEGLDLFADLTEADDEDESEDEDKGGCGCDAEKCGKKSDEDEDEEGDEGDDRPQKR